MVDQINGGLQQQIPAATTFEPGKPSLNNQAVTQQANTSQNEAENRLESFNVVEQTNPAREDLLAARPEPRPDPNNISSSVNRGSALDITV